MIILRINKYLAACNVASRRKSEEIILAGKVKVNGVTVRDLSYQIDETTDIVLLNDKRLYLDNEKVYYILNKPQDVISAVSSRHDETTVVDLITDEKNRIFPVGRLDKDTEGLIILTNDGDLAYRLTHPKFEKSKTYEALFHGRLDSKSILKLSNGIMIEGKKTAKASVRLLKMIKGNSLVEITLKEGRNRQIRKMGKSIGHPVISLRRIEEEGIKLGKLSIGEYRKLTKKEIAMLKGQN